jgi:hypothetical protein
MRVTAVSYRSKLPTAVGRLARGVVVTGRASALGALRSASVRDGVGRARAEDLDEAELPKAKSGQEAAHRSLMRPVY